MRTGTLIVASLLCTAAAAKAQPPGTYDWQLQPYCNRIFVTLTKVGGVVTVEGFDDQCGAGDRLPITGASAQTLFTYQMGLHTVPAAGVPVQITADLDFGLNGTWRDSQGRTGTLVPNGAAAGPMLAVPLNVAPPTSIGKVQVNPAQIQLRVGGSCPAGQAMRAIASTGAVFCAPAAGGDITSVSAGAGLVGGGFAGAVGLMADFGGSGTATSVARSDHTHGFGTDNTSVGDSALSSGATGFGNSALGSQALQATTTGTLNSGVGWATLASNTSGHENTAVGAQALSSNTTGTGNTALGVSALDANATGGTNTAVGRWAMRVATSASNNTAVGASALDLTTTGSSNTAIGRNALIANTTGSNNIAIGSGAGNGLLTGHDNVYVQASAGGGAESNTLRLGSSLTRAFVGGIRGVATGANDAVAVVIDSQGQLGTISSSRRTKDDIAPLDPAVGRALQRLEPVQFRYTEAFTDGSRPLQYGLIAEDVAAVLPSLAATGPSGEIETVKYHVLPTLLLAEVQRLEQERRTLTATVDAQATAIAELRAAVAALQVRDARSR
ncbi:MAG: tail fiber domain-containing protein [Vicinamibacterales bacterium]